MIRLRLLPIGLLVCLLAATVSTAQESLPRVLILGDFVYRQPAAEVKKTLKGKAEVVYATVPEGEVHNSASLLKYLDSLLGEKNWDVIHFNCGLGDLIHRVPGLKTFRVSPKPSGGVIATPAEAYEMNLQLLVKKLKATEAKIIWASTTPIRHSSSEVFVKGTEITYNQIANRVMAEHDIAINNMYQYVYELIDMNKPASHGADPFSFEKKPIHTPIVEVISASLWEQ